MTDMWQVRMLWQGTDGGMPGTNTIYASTGDTDVDDLRTALEDAYTGFTTGQCSDDFNVTIPSTGDKIDSDTGMLSGIWTSGTDIVLTGTDTANRVTSISQILIQFHTDLVLNGRLLRGRIFLPGARVTGTTVGEVDPTMLAGIVATFEDNLTGRACVFSPTHKRFATITKCTGWSEFASLRSRRD